MSKHKPIEEILAGWDSYDRPKDGDLYEHYKGYRMEIVATGFLEDTETPCVIYRSLARGTIWVRTANNFLEAVEHNGKIVPRFKKI
jgi:hypothetical protein